MFRIFGNRSPRNKQILLFRSFHNMPGREDKSYLHTEKSYDIQIMQSAAKRIKRKYARIVFNAVAVQQSQREKMLQIKKENIVRQRKIMMAAGAVKRMIAYSIQAKRMEKQAAASKQPGSYNNNYNKPVTVPGACSGQASNEGNTTN